MSGFDDGPLTGAPLNKPKTAQAGDCCPPVVLQSGDYQVDAGQASTSVTFDGIFTGFSGTVQPQVRSTQYTITPPVLTGVNAITPGAAGVLDLYSVGLDTSNADGAFAIVFVGDCGCEDVVEVDLIAP